MEIEIEPDLKPSVGRFIEKGADSSVYQFGTQVVKVYQNHITSEVLELYTEVTNKSVSYLDQNPFQGNLFINNNTYPYSIRVNPILFAGQSPRFSNCLISVSEYIPGITLWDLLHPRPNSLDLTRSRLESLPSKKGLFFEQILQARKSYDPLIGSILPDLSRLEDELNTRFRIKSIRIADCNIKLRSETNKNLSLIITDLCSGLRWFEGI